MLLNLGGKIKRAFRKKKIMGIFDQIANAFNGVEFEVVNFTNLYEEGEDIAHRSFSVSFGDVIETDGESISNWKVIRE